MGSQPLPECMEGRGWAANNATQCMRGTCPAHRPPHSCTPPAQINLVQSTSATLPFENAKQIRTICVSPDGRLLLSIDQDGRALLINRKRRALLHHFTFKAPVRAAKFSPDGRYVACAVGRLLQVRRRGGATGWNCPRAECAAAVVHCGQRH